MDITLYDVTRLRIKTLLVEAQAKLAETDPSNANRYAYFQGRTSAAKEALGIIDQEKRDYIEKNWSTK